MVGEPTIEVKIDRAPTAAATIIAAARVESDGMIGRTGRGGTCERGNGNGNGKIVRDVPLTELPGLLERPDEFR